MAIKRNNSINRSHWSPFGFDDVCIDRGPHPDDDLDRQSPPRTKSSHPYSYDPFTVWGGSSKECNGSEYTDRLAEWYPKYHEIGRRIFGDRRWFGTHCHGEKIEEFLRELRSDPTLKLTRVVEYCNVSSGYPVWRVDFNSSK